MNYRNHTFFMILMVFVCWLDSFQAQAMTEEELCRLYLDVVEDAVTYFEPLWVDESERIPNSGFYDFRKYGNWRDEPYATIITISGNGMVQFCYSVLLREGDKEVFGVNEVPRETLKERIVQSLRWCCLTSSYVKNPYPYLPNTRSDFADGPYWKRQFSWRADEVGWLTMAAAVMWDELDEETKKLVEAVMIGGAPKERLVQSWYVRQGGNHDQVKQDLSSTMGAAFLFPERDDQDVYLDVIRGNGIDMVSTLQDFTNDTVAAGKPIREWAEGWNLYQDYSSDHHGWCNIWYGGDLQFEGRSYIELLSALQDMKVPETFNYPGNGFDGVLEWLKVLCLPQGEPQSTHGNEYDAFYGAGLLGYCYGAVIKKDPVAAAFEERAAQLLARHSRSIKQYDYHRNSWAKAATALLLHRFRGPRAEPLSFEAACRELDGTYHYRWQQNLIHRSAKHQASFAWGSISAARPHYSTTDLGICGFVFPSGYDEQSIEPLIYCHPKSLIGDIDLLDGNGEVLKESNKIIGSPESVYCYEASDTGFHTAGLVMTGPLERYYAFYSYADGPCILFTRFRAKEDCRVRWSGVPLYFFVREGLTGNRTYYDEMVTQPLEQSAQHESAWWCVNDQIGMAFLGNNQTVNVERSIGFNWARKPEYKDKCDGVFVSPLENQWIESGEIGVDVVAVIYPHTKHEIIAETATQLESKLLSLPDGWQGVFLTDPKEEGKRYVSIANFYGDQNETLLSISTAQGAPVLSVPMRIRGTQGSTCLQLEPLESFGETCDLFITAPKLRTIAARKVSDIRYEIKPLSDGLTTIQLMYCSGQPETIRISNESGDVLNQIKTTPGDQIQLSVEEPIILEFPNRSENDPIAPAVEISDIEVREDERVLIEIAAHDQSGIKSVELFCDGNVVEKITDAPYSFLHRPGKGMHTYQAAAVDFSANENRRVSFKRTIKVGPFIE